MDYLEYLIYDPLPDYFFIASDHNKNLGYKHLEITPDSYDINVVKPYHCGFKHIREITIPKVDKIKKEIKGIFIIEGDVKINKDYDYNTFLNENHKQPIWLGYKKTLSNYIVGNFLIYIPMTHWEEFKFRILHRQKQLCFSDRFFTKLYFNNYLKLKEKSVAEEIPHYSNILKGWRK